MADEGTDVWVSRHRRKQRRWRWFALYPLLAVMLLGVATPILIVVADHLKARREHARLQALAELKYPDPISTGRIEIERRDGMVIVRAPFMPLDASPAGLELRALAGRDATITFGVFQDVMLDLATTADRRLPARSYDVSPLKLRFGGIEHRVYSTEFEANQLGQPKEPHQNSVMHMSVPIEVFLEWIKATDASGSIGDFRFTLPEESRAILNEFAAGLKPSVRP